LEKKVLLVGGSGFVGRALIRRLRADGFSPLVFSRGGKTMEDTEVVGPDDEGLVPAEVLGQVCGIVNLAGESIVQRWNQAVKDGILSSRVTTTDRIVQALERNRARGLVLPEGIGKRLGGGLLRQ
jgi:uncharacterized protein